MVPFLGGAGLHRDCILAAFLNSLAVPRGKPSPYGSAAWLLQNLLALPSAGDRNYKTHIRILSGDRVLLASPEYNTRFSVSTDTLFGAVVQAHLSPEDRMFAARIGGLPLQTTITVVILGLMLFLPALVLYVASSKH